MFLKWLLWQHPTQYLCGKMIFYWKYVESKSHWGWVLNGLRCKLLHRVLRMGRGPKRPLPWEGNADSFSLSIQNRSFVFVVSTFRRSMPSSGNVGKKTSHAVNKKPGKKIRRPDRCKNKVVQVEDDVTSLASRFLFIPAVLSYQGKSVLCVLFPDSFSLAK